MFLLISRLERLNLVVEFYRETNVIEAVQEAVFVEGVDLKTVRRLIGTRDTLGIEIDGDFRTRAIPQLLAQFRTHLFRQPNGQYTVLDAVVVVDIGDAGRDYRTNAVRVEGGYGVLPRRSASPIDVRDKNAAIPVRRRVVHEILFGTVFVEAQVVEYKP